MQEAAMGKQLSNYLFDEGTKDYGNGVTARKIKFFCPGCKDVHHVIIECSDASQQWTWNQDIMFPTFEPSILTKYGDKPGDERCHCYVEMGKIRFLPDSTHEFACQTVELPALPDWLQKRD